MSSAFSRFFQSITGKNKRKDSNDSNAEGKEESSAKNAVKDVKLRTQMPPDTVDPAAVTRARRRLSIDGHDVSLDGVIDLETEIAEEPVEEPKCEAADLFVGIFAGKSQKGYVPYNPRKVNQDFMLIREDIKTKTLVLGTFDGHGEHGHCISEFICTNFYNHLVEHEKFATDMKTAGIEAIQKAEEECIKSRFIKTEFSGTTAVICLIRGKHLITFNIGDSRAILASEINEECVVTELTHDHKPSLPEEKERIIQHGGRVFSMEYDDGYDGPARVWLADQDIPGLAMSRSLCDTVAHSVGVISTPEIGERDLTDDDRVIVMGSDGLWEFISSEEVIRLIEDCEQPDDAVERLCTIAWKRWFDAEKVVDDTTIIVVFLGKEDSQ